MQSPSSGICVHLSSKYLLHSTHLQSQMQCFSGVKKLPRGATRYWTKVQYKFLFNVYRLKFSTRG